MLFGVIDFINAQVSMNNVAKDSFTAMKMKLQKNLQNQLQKQIVHPHTALFNTFNCPVATVSSGQYQTCSIPNVCKGTTIVATTCPNAPTTDTTLSLYDANGLNVANNDDNGGSNGFSSCSKGSYLSYNSSWATCQTFSVKLGLLFRHLGNHNIKYS